MARRQERLHTRARRLPVSRKRFTCKQRHRAGGSSMFMTAYARSSGELLRTVCSQRRLLAALAKRDLSDDYVAHRLSMTWTIIQPLFLMLVYLFVFTAVYPTRVGTRTGFTTDATVYPLSWII